MLVKPNNIKDRAARLVKITSTNFKVFYHPSFDDTDKEAEITAPMPRYEDFKERRHHVQSLKQSNVPEELAPFYQEPLLDKDQEYHLFRQMNYYKYRAKSLAARLRPAKAGLRLVRQIEELLEQAKAVKHQLVCSNTRLAAQILRRQTDFHRAHSLVSDLLGDAFLNIVKAVDCFDFTLGYKFSTYATWVLVNNFNRDVNHERDFNERFVTGFDEAAYDTRLDTSDEDIRDYEEGRELTASNVSRLLGLLDREEDQRKRFVIEEWYGLRPGRGKRTLQNISKDLGLTKERVRQLRERGLERIRERVRAGDVKID